jgi:L-2-hydroxyglutarate oxidase LhgO
MTERVDCLVVGAGVVGLACARALAGAGREVLVVEREAAIGTGVSARSSEVIHAGIYYPPDSLKARLCLRGRDLLYAYCAAHGVAHSRCGKLLVATQPAQIPALDALQADARAAGMERLERISAQAARRMEPALHCAGALWSPTTGIVDSHALMLALLGDAQRHGAVLALRSAVVGATPGAGGIAVELQAPAPMMLRAALVVNCAGLDAQALAGRIRGLPAASIPARRLVKGNYFALQGRAPFSRLIYPLPEPGGLGVHLTLDLAGQAKFGPDVEAIDRIDYDVDAGRAARFYESIRRYWPALPDGALRPAYAGIRPKLPSTRGDFADFVIAGPEAHGVEGLIQLFGIESPGLTAALAIGEMVAHRARGR